MAESFASSPKSHESLCERKTPLNSEINRQRITEIYELIEPYIRRTPVLEADGRDFDLPAVRLSFKLELLQHSGSFKARGAFANLLSRKIPKAGVVAASGGNHGAAVAFAAKRLGVPARIFVPSIASSEKIERIRGYGAELVIGGERYAGALAASEKWALESGAMAVHAYDQVETLLGQGTVALEMESQCPQLATLLVAVGGGGLLGGIAEWCANRVKVIGVEPEAAPTLTRALEAGRPVDSPAGGIAADSLAPKRVGELMLPLAQQYASGVVLVSDEAIQEAQAALWRVLRIVAEPGGAAAFAALLSRKYVPAAGERIGVVICGGNTTAVNFEKPKTE
ncbi:MAG TPA: threonine/serine dehydratase [Candidatus Acidoferrales bacterium]|nr:threonine/serine dehydratase [Candidatus Acidoferrales bacterium]